MNDNITLPNDFLLDIELKLWSQQYQLCVKPIDLETFLELFPNSEKRESPTIKLQNKIDILRDIIKEKTGDRFEAIELNICNVLNDIKEEVKEFEAKRTGLIANMLYLLQYRDFPNTCLKPKLINPSNT